MVPLFRRRSVTDFGHAICNSCLESMSVVFNVLHYNSGIGPKENTVNRKIYVKVFQIKCTARTAALSSRRGSGIGFMGESLDFDTTSEQACELSLKENHKYTTAP